MKNPLFVVSINIILMTVVLFIAETVSYHSLFVEKWYKLPDYNKFKKTEKEFLVDNHPLINYEQPKISDPIRFENDGRSFNGKNYNTDGVLLLGDSYTYGLGLKKEETFGYQLSQYLKKPVYNWGWCTEGLDYDFLVIKNLKNIELIKKSKNKQQIKYVILTYTYNQPKRLLLKNRQYRYFLLRQYGLIQNQKASLFDRLYIVQVIKNKLFLNSLKNGDYQNNLQNFLFSLITAIKKEIAKNFPKAKFILLIYSDDANVIKGKNLQVTETEMNILNSPNWKQLEKYDITVVKTEDLLGRKMQKDEIIDDEKTITIHPNAKAWRTIIPKLCKKISL